MYSIRSGEGLVVLAAGGEAARSAAARGSRLDGKAGWLRRPDGMGLETGRARPPLLRFFRMNLGQRRRRNGSPRCRMIAQANVAEMEKARPWSEVVPGAFNPGSFRNHGAMASGTTVERGARVFRETG